MINEQYIDLVIARIEGSITAEQHSRLNELINRGEIDILEVKELEKIYHKMDTLPGPEPSEEMSNRFYRMLEQEKKKQSASSLSIRKIQSLFKQLITITRPKEMAFALGIFVAGMLIGNRTTPFQDYRQQLKRLTGEVSQMREVMVMTLLDNESVTERLKAVNISTELQAVDTDNKVAHALLKTLQSDPNVNVRLAAIEALLHRASNPRIREGLINAISTQESPIIQAALADAMLILQEKRSVEKFRELLDQNDLDRNLRNKLQYTVTALS